LVKLLQTQYAEEEEENRVARERTLQCDHFVRLMEERLIGMR